MKNIRNFTLIIIVISYFIQQNAIPHPEHMIWSDMQGYYVYLPSVFIYGDFTKDALRDTNYIKPLPGKTKVYTKYTCGVALMEMPIFLLTHAYVLATDGIPDGKNPIYGRGRMLSGLFYFWIGMLVLHRLLRRSFESNTTIIALICIALGTNLYYYTIFQPGMSHVYSFCLFAIFLRLNHDILIENHLTSQKHWFVFGICFGLMVLIRPTSIIMGILPLYIIRKNHQKMLTFGGQHIIPLLTAIGAACIPFIPQFLYWHYVSGDWIIYSYGEEGFKFWREPKLIRVLFDAWNGWILYSPMVLIPLCYLWFRRRSNIHYERGYLYIFLLATYIFSSWWAWWFGGAFGHRSYVEYTSLLAIPMAASVHTAMHKTWEKVCFLALITILCYYNIGLTYAYRAPWDGESWTYLSWWIEVKKLFVCS